LIFVHRRYPFGGLAPLLQLVISCGQPFLCSHRAWPHPGPGSHTLSPVTILIIANFLCCRYFEAASPSSIERNIYSVPIPVDHSASFKAVEPTALTDPSVPSFYAADFSSRAGFYLLSYRGPDVPWQKVIMVNNTGKARACGLKEYLIG
jgi:hypothetical protein